MTENIVWLMLMKDNQTLLMKSLFRGKEEYILIGGHLEENESLKQALKRESYEEIGITINEEDLVFKTIIDGKMDESHKIHFFFTSNNWEGEIFNKEPNKHISVTWYSLNNLPSALGRLAKKAIDSLTNNQSYYEVG